MANFKLQKLLRDVNNWHPKQSFTIFSFLSMGVTVFSEAVGMIDEQTTEIEKNTINDILSYFKTELYEHSLQQENKQYIEKTNLKDNVLFYNTFREKLDNIIKREN